MVVVDRDGRIRIVNRETEKLFGYERARLVGQSIEMLVPVRAPEAHALHRSRFFEDPRARPMGRGLELHGLRRDGTEFSAEISLAPLHAGATLFVTAAIRDVSERHRELAELREAKEKAEAVSRELEAFSDSVAHDLRAPLRGIEGFSALLLRDCGDRLDDDGRKHLGYVRESARHMGRLIGDLLKLSRVTRSDLLRKTVDLSALVHEAVERLRRSDPGRVVELSIESGIFAEADPRLLAVVIENLLGNAWKFTSKKSTARIEFGVVSVDGQRTYFVRDDGAGFDMAYASKLFGVFQRLHGAKEFEGTGIGLATVQRVVQRHGGRVWAEGAVDRGATLRFTLGESEAMRR